MEGKKERIGFDFDGTLTKLPPLIAFITSILNAKVPRFLLNIWYRGIACLPIFLNHKRLKLLRKKTKDFNFYLITARKGSQRQVEQKLLNYDYDLAFKEIIAQKKSSKLPPYVFKEKLCKALEIDRYFEDNRYTIYYLRTKGIKAIKA